MQYPEIKPVRRSTWFKCLLLPIPVLAMLTAGFILGDWDRKLVSMIFHDGVFLYRDLAVIHLIYKVAAWPSILLAVSSIVYVLLPRSRRRPGDLRLIALGICLSVLIGPGVVVNFVFKDNYGRPRPKQVEEFGGDMLYRAVLVPGTEKYARSFPSGHSASGYILLVMFLVGLAVRDPRAWWALAFALPYGTLVGLARVLQGAHWPSDIIWSCGIVYYTTFVILYGLGILRPVKAEAT